ncbi:MAG: DUF4286 family protein [Tannerella sp.]|jgi:hypothetical protein|nr:DUF4286 family protein [Tannerella sp.]
MIYHTTFHLDDAIWDEGLHHLKQHYIPGATQSGLLRRPAMQRVLQEEEAGVSICIQFHVSDRDVLHRWMQCEGAELQRELTVKFGAKIAGFSTLPEEMELE